MKKVAKLSAVSVPHSAPRVVGEERFQQIMVSLHEREKITGDKGQEIPFAGETKEQFIRACKTAYPVIKKTYEGMNDLGRILGEVRTRLKPLGVYHAWLEFINLPKRTAQNYVQVYDRYREHLPQFAHLGIRKLLIASKLEDCTDYLAKNLPRIEAETADELETQVRAALNLANKTKKPAGRPPSEVFKFPDCTVRTSSKGDKITIEGLTKDTQAKLIIGLKTLLSRDNECGGHGGHHQCAGAAAGLGVPVETTEEDASDGLQRAHAGSTQQRSTADAHVKRSHS